eukprot:m.153611 g.153611  ORF g.153611 m.153611 type:complete len:60 (+) comp38621_c0_seq51:63-242(+)
MACLLVGSADFEAPDAGPDLYHRVKNPGKDDLQWQEWLADLMRTDIGQALSFEYVFWCV